MAQGETASTLSIRGHALNGLTQKEIYEIEQYEKIVRFRDMVLSGNHPTIKLPPGWKALAQSLPSQAQSPLENGVNSGSSKIQQPFPTNAKAPELEPSAFADTDASPVPQGVPSSSGGSGRAAEINPILLEKSDELIKAELQLQRQRLERALKDEIEQRRTIKQLAEPFDVDLSDVLAKALTIVEATDAPLLIDEDLTANNEAASDSFDDNTFYSSHHDTPESNLTSRIRDLSEGAQAPGTSKSQQESPSRRAPTNRNQPASPNRNKHDSPVLQPAPQLQHGSPINNTGSRPGRIIVPGLNNYIDGVESSTAQGQTTSGEQSRSVDLGIPEGEPLASQRGNDSLAPSPLVGNRSTLLPAAPYATQTSSLAVRVPIPISPGIGPAVGTPAQVVALRNEPATATSSDTSSQGERDAGKKRGKKKKRKAERQAPETEVGPYIKPEPRSPSPLTAPYARPNKRQRQAQAQAAEPSPVEASYSRSMMDSSYDPQQPHIHRDGRVPIVYGSPTTEPRRAVNTAAVGDDSRYGREYVDEHQISGGAYMRRPPSPGGPSYQYSPREAHPARAVSRAIVNDLYREPPRVYRESLEGPRMSVRPEGDSFIVPPRPPPTRIVVDAYGREYIEPPHPTIRQSVAPPFRPGEGEIVYERVPPRAVSGHPAVGPYDDGSVVYTRPPSSYAVARRYVTQPEYVPHDYRESRPREYSTQPIGSGEYVRIMSPHDRRPIEERPREYVSRSSSLRPSEALRFEAPHSYGRMHSVRPEVPAREYAGSVHPESRHAEGAPTYVGEYSGSVQQPYVRREYSVRPAERYHESHGTRAPEEIAFIEGPRRPTQEIVYIDDGRRAVYR